jgi:hypothetical protein
LTNITGSSRPGDATHHPDRMIGERGRDLHRALAAVDQSS